MSLSEIDWANATWTEWLQVSVLGNPLAAWAVALLVTFVVASVLPVIKGFIGRRLRRRALFRKDIPPKVTIDEAVELGKKYGTEDSGAFINGVLDNIYNQLQSERSKDEAV